MAERKRLRSAFAEVGYGVCFYLLSMAGALIGGLIWSGHISHGIEEHTQWLVQGAIGGAIIGGTAWLWFKYNRTDFRQLWHGLTLLTFAILGMAVVDLAQSPDPDFAVFSPLVGAVAGVFAWVCYMAATARK